MPDKEIIWFPTFESAFIALTRYAKDNQIEPAQLMEIFELGCVACQVDCGFGPPRPHLVKESLIIEKGFRGKVSPEYEAFSKAILEPRVGKC